jgi:hypothetical protein
VPAELSEELSIEQPAEPSVGFHVELSADILQNYRRTICISPRIIPAKQPVE